MMKKVVALLLALALLPLSGAFAVEFLPQDTPINRRKSGNNANTLDFLPEAAKARTDSIVIGVPDLLGETNPFWVQTTGDHYAASLMYDELVFADNAGTVGTGVASFTTSGNGKTVTFTISDKALYADGMALTSDDFINAMYLMLTPGFDGVYDVTGLGIAGVQAYLAGEADAISGIEKHSDKSFSVTRATGNPDDLIYFAFPALRYTLFGEVKRPEGLAPEEFDAHYAMVLETVKSVDATQMAYGQYLPESMAAGEHAVFTKNVAYWRGEPYVSTMELLVVAAGHEADAILDGSVDIISMLGSVEVVDAVVDYETGFVNLYTWPGDVVGYLGLDLDDPLFADLATRQALAIGFDRELARQSKVERYGNVPGTLLFDSFSVSTSNVLGELYAYDVERAQALLAQAGWAREEDDGLLMRGEETFTFTLLYNVPNPIMEMIVRQMQNDYRALGIELELEPVSFETLIERIALGDYDMYFQARRLPHSPVVAADLFAGESHLNASGYRSDVTDRLLAMAAGESDSQRQMMIYEMLFQELYVDLPFIPLYRRHEFLLVNARVMNAEITTAHEITADAYRFFLTDTLKGQW